MSTSAQPTHYLPYVSRDWRRIALQMAAEAGAEALFKGVRNPQARVRHRIHHAYLPTARALELMRTSETIAILQPAFIYNLGESYIKSLGLNHARRMNPYRTYLMNAITLAGSSDSAVTDYNPWVGLYAAVKHQTVLGTPFDQRENLTTAEALRIYTRGSAYVTFEEAVMGSIETGKYADFVVVAEDVLTMPPDELKDVKPQMTAVGGKVVFGG